MNGQSSLKNDSLTHSTVLPRGVNDKLTHQTLQHIFLFPCDLILLFAPLGCHNIQHRRGQQQATPTVSPEDPLT